MKKSLSDLAPIMRPWHCLVCCSGFGGSDLADRARRWLRAGALDSADFADDGSVQSPTESDSPDEMKLPSYVAALLDGAEPELPSDLGGVLVIKERAPTA